MYEVNAPFNNNQAERDLQKQFCKSPSVIITYGGVDYTFESVPESTVTASIGNSGGPFYHSSGVGITISVQVASFWIGES
ncbi:MAG: hypothetical protein LBT84_04630 [Spirochaetia bacterium]|jgi:hypothetical protein|nr:hypothetical protein [Spirochaetia bacterium]